MSHDVTARFRNYLKSVSVPLQVVILLIGIGVGIYVGPAISSRSTATASQAIRLGGYKFISPLLIGDANTQKDSSNLDSFQHKLATLVSQEVEKNNLTTASIYFRELNSGFQTNVNPNEKYFPASLNKILIMIAYLNSAQSNPDVLSQRITVTNRTDYNSDQEIKPGDPVKMGSTYTVEDLIERMIRYSDNNADHALIDNIEAQKLNIVSQDLRVPIPSTENVGSDYMTAGEFTLFLRILYNSTYLNETLSEHALQVLSESDFKSGLVAGVPTNITVSHKYGLVGYIFGQTEQAPKSRELHDCGIIYNPRASYILCVMTKSSASLANIETAIKDISSLVYQQVSNNYH